MKLSDRIALVTTVLVLSIGGDQALKQIAGVSLRDGFPISLLHDFIRLQYAENRGIMLSIGSSLSPGTRFWVFVVALGVLLLGMLAYALWNKGMDRMQTIAWSLIVSGGLGNLLDRLTKNGVVIDYISVGVGVVRTAVFNLADVLVFAGVFLLLVHGTKTGRNAATGDSVDMKNEKPDVK